MHIGHNVELGAHCLIAAQTGIAGAGCPARRTPRSRPTPRQLCSPAPGSVTVGRGVLIGGQVGLAQHLTVGDGARIAARSAVMRDVEAGATVGASWSVPRYSPCAKPSLTLPPTCSQVAPLRYP